MKIDRQKVYEKYDKHCAYCGVLLMDIKDMQVDHKEPLRRIFRYDSEKRKYVDTNKMKFPQNQTFENCMPSCRVCNHYKSDMSLEQFRERMITIHERIKDRYIYKVAITYGIIVINPFDGKFYFEK